MENTEFRTPSYPSHLYVLRVRRIAQLEIVEYLLSEHGRDKEARDILQKVVKTSSVTYGELKEISHEESFFLTEKMIGEFKD